MKSLRLAAAVAASLLVTSCMAATPSQPSASSAGQSADLAALRAQYGLPDCPVTDPDAEAVDGGLPVTDLQCLGSDVRVNLAGLPRTPTIVNLWAQWCGPCREESPYLREGLARLGDSVTFIGVNYNDPQTDWAIEFAGLVGWTYPHIVDQDKVLQADLRVAGIPTTYFVDTDGRIAGVHAGPFESTDQLVELAGEYLGVS